MKKPLFFYIKPFLVIAAITMAVVCWLQGTPQNLNGWLGHIGTTAFFMSIISVVYIKWLWYYNPWEKIPRFAKKYRGKIHYIYEGCAGEKETEVFISQTLFSTRIKLKTNEIKSDAITSNLIEENDSWFLYYTYIKEPKAEYAAVNPIQRGTARLEIKKPECNLKTFFSKNKKTIDYLDGTYWTSVGTTGDMELFKESES